MVLRRVDPVIGCATVGSNPVQQTIFVKVMLMSERNGRVFTDFFDERERGSVMIKPLLGYHLQKETIKLLEAGERFHFEGAAGSVDEAVLSGSTLQAESQSSSQDLK